MSALETRTGKPNVLVVQSSASPETSTSNRIAQRIAESLGGVDQVRDLSEGVSLVDAYWVANRGKTSEEYDQTDREAFAESDALIAELQAAEVIVIGAPMYNFAIPASLKAWIDLIARPKTTFSYSAAGPEGLLKGKKVYVAFSSDGVPMGSAIDFHSAYLRHALGFVGLDDVTFISADGKMQNPEALDNALAEADAISLPVAA